MPISDNFKSVFPLEWEIDFTQCASNGKLKYTDMSHLLQLTASAHSDSAGMSFAEMGKNNQTWVLNRMHIEIDEMPKWGDKVTVVTWIEYLDNGRSIRDFEMRLGDKKLLGASSLWVVLDTNLRRAAKELIINSDFLTRYPDRKPTSKDNYRINFAVETELVEQRTVRLSDLDIVKHVNNVKYVEWCLDVFDVNLIFEEQIKEISANYFRELSIGDVVNIKKIQENNEILFTVEKNSKVCFCMKIVLNK